MNKEFYNIYEYLKKEGFCIDLTEFDLQIQAHPAYPSLLSITDTLSFFNIDNGVFHIDLSHINSLPNRFMTILRDENYERRYFIIEAKKENYICYSGNNKIKISKKELESQWSGVVILIENPELEKRIKKKRNNLNLIFFNILLIVIGVIGYFTFFNNGLKRPSPQLLIIFGFIFLFGIIAWNILKKMRKAITTEETKENKSIHNYRVFKDTLSTYNVLENNLPQSSTIQLGNRNVSLKILIVLNPFSNYCKENYFTMEKILQKYFDKICFEIRFNFNKNDYSNKNSKKIHQHLVAAYVDLGQDGFRKILNNWFKFKNEKSLYVTQISPSNELKINEILNDQFNSNSENNIIFTPTIVISKYIFPKQYDLKELSHFISELSEDKDFQKKK